MTVYVLGAGASLHAGYPLATQLGSELKKWMCRVNHPQLSCIDELERENQGLERLAQKFVRSGDTIVTFNYDPACERELKRAGLWEINDGYGFDLGITILPTSKTRVLKLHGSANWWELLFNGSFSFQQIDNSYGERPVLPFRPDFELFGYPESIRDTKAPCNHFSGKPAMIMPLHNKRFFEETPFGHELETFGADIWQQAESALGSTEEIIIVGFSMAAVDTRARNLLLTRSNRHARVAIYCGPSSKSIASDFRCHGFDHVNSQGNGFFEDYLQADAR